MLNLPASESPNTIARVAISALIAVAALAIGPGIVSSAVGDSSGPGTNFEKFRQDFEAVCQGDKVSAQGFFQGMESHTIQGQKDGETTELVFKGPGGDSKNQATFDCSVSEGFELTDSYQISRAGGSGSSMVVRELGTVVGGDSG